MEGPHFIDDLGLLHLMHGIDNFFVVEYLWCIDLHGMELSQLALTAPEQSLKKCGLKNPYPLL